MADKIFFKTGLASSLPTTKTAGQLLFAIDGTTGSIYLDKDSNTRIKFNADAVKLATPRSINGTSFDGTGNITTAKWGTARNISIGSSDGTNVGTAVSVDGSGAVTLKLPTVIKATVSAADKLTVNAGDSNTPVYFESGVPKAITSIDVKSDRAAKLDPGAKINGTTFTGESDITTSNWGTARTLSISSTAGTTGTSVNGSANASLIVPSTMTGFSSITSTKLIATTVASDTGHIVFPDGGQYTTTDSTKTGYLKITLPVSWSSAMIRFYVDIYNYEIGTSATYMIGGYNFANSSKWVRTYAQAIAVSGSKLGNLSVHFGHDGSKCAIYIGATDTSWDYPQVMIRDVFVGYLQNEKDYTTGWSIDFTTTLGTITQTVENTNVAYKLYTARTINGTSFDGSSNITTTNWGTSRNIYIQDSDGSNTGAAVSVNGGANATLKLPSTIKANLSGNATSIGDNSMKMYAQYNNEINFGGPNDFATIYFSYRATDSKPIISTFVFGGPTGTATLKAASFTGNAATASKLATARSITLAGDVTGSTSFDGSSNVSITATVANDSHNHTYSTISLLGNYVSNTTYTSLPNGITYVEMPATATSTGDPTYGAMLTVKYHEGRAFQLVGNSSNKFYFRGMHSGLSSDAGAGYGPWRAVALSDGGTYAMNITGNASGTANKLATPRNITISGTASNSIGTFDGGANTTLYMPLAIKGFTSIESDKFVVNDKVTLQYNTTNECLEFVFA